MSDHPVYDTVEQILTAAKKANGKNIASLNVNNRNLEGSNKGVIGQIIEEGVFGYPINSRAEPDFAKVGVELKVTGLKRNHDDSYVAKERLVLNIIDYMSEGTASFDTSSFWKKNSKLLLMFYFYDKQTGIGDFKIIDSILYTYPPEDLFIIKNDWEIINKKIASGEAQNISESDTMYLAACTKGANGEAVRPQPFSDELAKQRAFCLKPSYINQILRSHGIDKKAKSMFSVDKVTELLAENAIDINTGNNVKEVSINSNEEPIFGNNSLVNLKELQTKSFEHILQDRIKPYIGCNADELLETYGIAKTIKNKFELLISKILCAKGSINHSDEFLKANIVAKTVRIEENGRIIESMSLPNFKYVELVKETWFDSDLRNYFYETKFMFVVFKKISGSYIFKGIKFWNMPLEILDKEIYKVWEKTKEVVASGNIIKGYTTNKSGKTIRITNFPGLKENNYCHVRPHGQTANDTYPLPVKDKLSGLTNYTKHCFWLNSKFVLEILKDLEK